MQDNLSITHLAFPVRVYGQLTQEKPEIKQHLRRHHPEHVDPYTAMYLYIPDDVREELDRRGGQRS